MHGRELVDLSHPLSTSHISIYPDDPPFSCVPHASIASDGCNVRRISLGSHTGTHIDAPSHFIPDGASIDQLPLSLLTGPVVLVDLTHKKDREPITWDADIAAYSDQLKPGTILLLHTGYSQYWSTPKYIAHPYLTRDAAERIIQAGVKVIGIDAFSPDETSASSDYAAHHIILGAGGVIAENLTNLEALRGRSAVVCLFPLNVDGSDGAPVRAHAWIE